MTEDRSGPERGAPLAPLRGHCPDVSIVTAIYRNADTVVELASRLHAVMAGTGLSHEIIFVDDACPAGSGPYLRALSFRDPRVRVVTHAENVGQDPSLRDGMRIARGRYTVLIDADLQDPPEQIPALLDRLTRGDCAAVFAGRRGAYESRSRLLTSWLYKGTMALLLHLPPDAGLFVALTGDMRERVLAMPAHRPWILAFIGASQLPVVSIPLDRHARGSGRSAYGTWRRFSKGVGSIAWAIRWRLFGFGAKPPRGVGT